MGAWERGGVRGVFGRLGDLAAVERKRSGVEQQRGQHSR
jgi:hypothetical protein